MFRLARFAPLARQGFQARSYTGGALHPTALALAAARGRPGFKPRQDGESDTGARRRDGRPSRDGGWNGPPSRGGAGDRAPRDGGRAPRGDGPFTPRDGGRPPFKSRDGGRPPFTPDGGRAPFTPRDGGRPPFTPRDGGRPSRPDRASFERGAAPAFRARGGDSSRGRDSRGPSHRLADRPDLAADKRAWKVRGMTPPTSTNPFTLSQRVKKHLARYPDRMTRPQVDEMLAIVRDAPPAMSTAPVWNLVLARMGRDGYYTAMWKAFNEVRCSPSPGSRSANPR